MYALLGTVIVLLGYVLFRHDDRIPVLIYHDISPGPQLSSSYTVDVSLLRRELEYLQNEGYTPLTFAAAALLRAEGKLPEKPIILSFDDALPGHMHALTQLQTKRMTAIFFVNSDLLGDATHLSWDNVREIADAGMEIGGHTANHVHPLQLNEVGLFVEIIGDKQHIEREIGKPVTVFAYPFQERNAETDRIVEHAGYSIVRDTPDYKSTVMTNSFEAFLQAI